MALRHRLRLGDRPETYGRGDPHHHILYVDLPTGQVSFHTGTRGEGPDYAGEWDGAKGTAAERVCRFVAGVFKMAALGAVENQDGRAMA
jgi:hypothetical protein